MADGSSQPPQTQVEVCGGEERRNEVRFPHTQIPVPRLNRVKHNVISERGIARLMTGRTIGLSVSVIGLILMILVPNITFLNMPS